VEVEEAFWKGEGWVWGGRVVGDTKYTYVKMDARALRGICNFRAHTHSRPRYCIGRLYCMTPAERFACRQGHSVVHSKRGGGYLRMQLIMMRASVAMMPGRNCKTQKPQPFLP